MKVHTTQLCRRWGRLSMEMKLHLSWRSYQTSIPRRWVFLTKIQRWLIFKIWISEDPPNLKPLVLHKSCPVKKRAPVIQWTTKTSCGMPSSRPREIKRKNKPLSKRWGKCKLSSTSKWKSMKNCWQKEIVRLQTLGRPIWITLRSTANKKGNLIKDHEPQCWSTLHFLNRIRTSNRWSSTEIVKTLKEGMLILKIKI